MKIVKYLILSFLLLFSTNLFAKKLQPENLVIYQDQCTLEHSLSCLKLGLYYEYSEEKDINKSLIYYKKACDLDQTSGCFATAEIHRWGKNGVLDIQKALKFYQKGCKLGDRMSCSMVEIITQEKVPKKQSNCFECDEMHNFFFLRSLQNLTSSEKTMYSKLLNLIFQSPTMSTPSQITASVAQKTIFLTEEVKRCTRAFHVATVLFVGLYTYSIPGYVEKIGISNFIDTIGKWVTFIDNNKVYKLCLQQMQLNWSSYMHTLLMGVDWENMFYFYTDENPHTILK